MEKTYQTRTYQTRLDWFATAPSEDVAMAFVEDGSLRDSICQEMHSRMKQFVGWLSADIPELHGVEMPRLAESLDRFLGVAQDATK